MRRTSGGITPYGIREDAGMLATHNRLVACVATMMAGWLLALHALNQMSAWAVLAGIAFLAMVGWGVLRAARI